MNKRSSKSKTSFVSLGLGKVKSNEDDTISIGKSTNVPLMYSRSQSMAIRNDSLGYTPGGHHGTENTVKIDSLSYQTDESEVFRAYNASKHYRSRGNFWNDGKREIIIRYINLTMIGVGQGTIAYCTNIIAKLLIEVSGYLKNLLVHRFFISQEIILLNQLYFHFFIIYRY